MKRVIIVQARMTSTRLPGKVMMELAGHPMLTQQLRRLKRCKLADEIVLATTTNLDDAPLISVAESEGVRWFRGDEHDVLSRYLGAAQESQADIIVRITSDCPLINPAVVDRVIQELNHSETPFDYASNCLKRTFPLGLDAEAFFRDALVRMGRMAQSVPAREHVTYYLTDERPDLFARRVVVDTEDNSDLRWTVDTAVDLELVRRIYEGLDLGQQDVGYREILGYVRRHSELATMNAHVPQKPY